MSDQETVLKGVNAIKGGPRALRLYMDVCAKCGTCAEVCPVYYGKQDPKYNPANRSDLIRSLYKRHKHPGGQDFRWAVRSEGFRPSRVRGVAGHLLFVHDVPALRSVLPSRHRQLGHYAQRTHDSGWAG